MPISKLALHAVDRLPDVFETVKVRGDTAHAYVHASGHMRMKTGSRKARRIRLHNVTACIRKNILVSPGKSSASIFYSFIEYDQQSGFIHRSKR